MELGDVLFVLLVIANGSPDHAAGRHRSRCTRCCRLTERAG
jgi:hypothetical protein